MGDHVAPIRLRWLLSTLALGLDLVETLQQFAAVGHVRTAKPRSTQRYTPMLIPATNHPSTTGRNTSELAALTAAYRQWYWR
jgi:hypothetical protein